MLDHIIVLTEDLARFRSQFETDTGVALTVGGAHPGIGSANLLASLGDGVYMEVMGPDPAFETPQGLGARLAAQGAPRIGGFAARTADIGATAAAVAAAGLDAPSPTAGSRAAPDGSVIAWTALFTGGHDHGDQVPFFIDWGATAHPSTTSAQGLELLSFEVVHPEPDRLSELYAHIGVLVEVVGGAAPGFRLRMRTPRGEHALASELGQRIFAPEAVRQG